MQVEQTQQTITWGYIYQCIKLNSFVSSSTILILSGVLTNPKMNIIEKLLKQKNIIFGFIILEAPSECTKEHNIAHFIPFLLVCVENYVGVTIKKLAIVILGPVGHLNKL